MRNDLIFVYNKSELQTLNKGSMDLREYMGTPVRRIITAFCSSYSCVGKERMKSVRKFVSKDTDFCPDCESALLWKVKVEKT